MRCRACCPRPVARGTCVGRPGTQAPEAHTYHTDMSHRHITRTTYTCQAYVWRERQWRALTHNNTPNITSMDRNPPPLHTCMSTYRYTHIHAYMHVYIHTYIQTNKHIYIHTRIHTYTHTYINAYIHTYIHTYKRTCDT